MKNLIPQLLLFSLFPLPLLGQFNEIEFQIPSAASLMQSVDYPVSHSTGIPDISIPLYSINCGDLTLPVVLSFHVDSFMRAHRIAEPPGLGWSLSTDIKITRVINGIDDFTQTYGYYFRRDLPVTDDEINAYRMTKQYQYQIHAGIRDEEPDKFYYRLLNKSGTFYFRHTAEGVEAVQVPNNGVKVEYIPDTWSFKLTDTDGTVYHFPQALRDEIIDENQGPLTVGWNCSNIVSASGADEITFGYNKISNIHRNYFENIEIYDQYNKIGPYGQLIEGFGVPPPIGEQSVSLGNARDLSEIVNIKVVYRSYEFGSLENSDLYIYSKHGIRGRANHSFSLPKYSTVFTHTYYPEIINYRGGSLEFTYQPSPDLYEPPEKITNIKAYGPDNRLIKEIKFLREPQTPIYRKFEGKALTSIMNGDEEYKFDYDFSGHYQGQRPSPDFWGYAYKSSIPLYNNSLSLIGGSGALSEVPGNSISGLLGLQDPCPSPSTYKYEPRMTIEYPTKGTVNFVFEENRFSDANSRQKLSGGFRIKKITYSDSEGKLIREKNYKYGRNEDGNGLLRFVPHLVDQGGNCHTTQTVNYIQFSSPNNYTKVASERKRTIFTFPAASTSFGSGSTIFYNEVAEYDSDMGETSGKVVYTYNTPERFMLHGTSYEAPPFIFGEYTWDMCHPASVTRYRYKQGEFEWVNKVEYDYSCYMDPNPIYIGRVWAKEYAHPVNQFSMLFDNIQFAFEFSPLTRAFRTGNMQLNSVKESDRSANGLIRERLTNYYYDNPNNYTANRSETILHDGTVLTEQTIYPEDYASSAEIHNFINKNIVSIPMEKISRRDNRMVSGELYKYNPDGKITGSYSLDRELTESEFKLSNKRQGYFGEGNSVYSPYPGYEKDVEIIYRGSYSLPVEIIRYETGRNVSTTFLWGYKGTYPIAKIKNATYQQVSNAVGPLLIRNLEEGSDFTYGDLTQLGSLLYGNTQLPDVEVSLYRYKPGIGITDVSDDTGKFTHYEYDGQGRLTSVRDDKMNPVEDYIYNFKR